MNESSFNDYMQDQIGITEEQWAWVQRNLSDSARAAMIHVSALKDAGFTRGEAIQIYCAVNGGNARTLQLVAPQGDDIE